MTYVMKIDGGYCFKRYDNAQHYILYVCVYREQIVK